tara:strand:- start:2124 stop:2273 length:150 start_codon:yes stop_codon:yes gene_type:complete
LKIKPIVSITKIIEETNFDKLADFEIQHSFKESSNKEKFFLLVANQKNQ